VTGKEQGEAVTGAAMWSLAASAPAIGGRLIGDDAHYNSVTTDSRGNCHGRLFVALRGERFDGHEFVAAALANGAVGAIVDHPVDSPLAQIIVDDTRLALGRLAAAWRDRIDARVIAITGSNGKTTVKEMTAAILSVQGETRATEGNLNNDIGMPLTLLSARAERYLILEMGANHHGEIGYMTDIARPDVALITNAGRAHLEGFGSVEGVAHAKGEIARGLPRDGTFVVMDDVPWTPLWRQLADGRSVLTFGTGPHADVRADEEAVSQIWNADGFRTRFTAFVNGTAVEIALPLTGSHNVRNALAAIAGTTALGADLDSVRTGLERMVPVRRRLQPRRTRLDARLLDDTYNANPDSLAAAVSVLTGLTPGTAGRHLLVLGDFGELGPDAGDVHRQMGVSARSGGIDALYAVGPLSAEAVAGFGERGRHFRDQQSLIDALEAEHSAADLLLVKGSRASSMDRVADALCLPSAGSRGE
jgi:UDP-N-acetylmuramoyl-tripeptide--D-alanyl-D-alanine ligase